MIKKLAFCLLLINAMTCSCQTGCLKCKSTGTSTTQTCVLCDAFEGYFLSDTNSCVQNQLTNCSFLGQTGACLECDTGYYVTDGKCVAVESQNLIQNCNSYSGAITCVLCEICESVPAEARIQNCEYYTGDKLCAYCQNGYIIREEGISCEMLPSTGNCMKYTDLDCLECNTGYIKNKNLYKISLFNFDTTLQRNALSLLIAQYHLNYKFYDDQNVCQLIIVQNCAVAETYNKCKECVDGYYLNVEKQCIQDLDPKIRYCTVYEYDDTQIYNYKCIECEQGYYVNSNQCIAVEQIDNCKTYFNDYQITTYCKTCKDTHFLLSINKCEERVNYSINNCQTYQLEDDECEICMPNFFLASDGIHCYQEISNCNTHAAIYSGSDMTEIICTGCNNGYYLSSSVTCTKGTISNCEVYEQQPTQICSKCQDQYYTDIIGTVCDTIHPQIERCIDYDEGMENICHECQPEYSPVVYNQICVTVVQTTIDFCTLYDLNTPFACTACEDNYRLVDGACVLIGDDCKTWHTGNSECNECQENFYLYDENPNNCRGIPDYVTNLCSNQQVQTAGSTFNLLFAKQCSICEENASPLTEKTYYPCIENEILDVLNFTHAIDKCVKYAADSTCLQCESGYYLNATNTACANTCNSTQNPITLDTANTPTVFELNKCNVQSNQTLIRGHDVNPKNLVKSDDVEFSCIDSLPTGILNVYDLPYTNINIKNLSSSYEVSDDWVDHVADVWPKVSCADDTPAYIDSATAVNNFNNVTYNQRLKLYKKTGTNPYYYTTIRCNWGQTGLISSYNAGGNDHFYVNCDATNDFDNTVYYYNIPPYWSQFFSVHKCTSTNDIPVLVYSGAGGDDIEFDAYQKWTARDAVNNDWDTGADYFDNIICLNLSNSDDLINVLNLSTTRLNTNFTSMTNCGLAVLNLQVLPDSFDNMDYAEDVDANRIGNQTIYCAACLPGYHEDPDTTEADSNYSNSVFRNCVAISNCNLNGNNNLFNGCGECNTGYTWAYESEEIVYDKCIAIPSYLTNCMAYEETNDKCAFCEKGYYLNLDNACVQITVGNCDSFVNYQTSGSYQARQYIQQYGQGCTRCSLEFTSVETHAGDSGIQLCYSSNYLEGTAISATTGVNENIRTVGIYVVHCAKYNTQNKRCELCDEGYVPNDHNGEPSLCTFISNCDLTNADGTLCKECSLGYAMVNSACVKGTIENCVEYDETTKVNTTQHCDICKDGYYLTSTYKCAKGYVPFCKTFRDKAPNQCSECQLGYTLVRARNDYGYLCIKTLVEIKCEDVTLEKTGLIFQATCNTCDAITDKITLVDLEENISTGIYGQCYPINNITGCEEYNNSVVDEGITFQLACTKCTNQAYYLNPRNLYECVSRTNTDDYCLIYKEYEDLCDECMQGYYLNLDINIDRLCVPYPSGDYHCIDYVLKDDKLICTNCEDDFYLLKGNCYEINTFVSHCAHHSGDYYCDECHQGYFLTDPTQCTLITIQNCDEYENAYSCAVCETTFKKTTVNGISTCSKYENMNNCLEEKLGLCVQCSTGYYPDSNGLCAAVTIITGCIYYDTQTTCTQCSPTYSLSTDRTQCILDSGIDSHCQITVYKDTPQCSICSAGYAFDDEICKSNNLTTIAQGCFDEDENGKCLFCISGWSMLSAGICTDNQPKTTTKYGFLMIPLFALFSVFFQ